VSLIFNPQHYLFIVSISYLGLHGTKAEPRLCQLTGAEPEST
jgi:hypothetical protein